MKFVDRIENKQREDMAGGKEGDTHKKSMIGKKPYIFRKGKGPDEKYNKTVREKERGSDV